MMRQRLPNLTSLLILIMVFQYGCGELPTTPPQPTTISTRESIQEIPSPSQPASVEQVGVTPTIESPIKEEQPSNVIPAYKPSLTISNPNERAFLPPGNVFSAHTVGFIFPDGLVAAKAAAVSNPSIIEENLTAVGVIEIGQGAEKITPGVYVVAIDLTNTGPQVAGRVLMGDSRRDLVFDRTALIRNPARQDSATFPAISPIISSHAVCFVVALFEPKGKGAQAGDLDISWVRYCSLNSLDTGEPILSVRDNFPLQFEELISRWDESIKRLERPGFPSGVEIAFELTISELEGHPNIVACNENNECAADITGAPSVSFWSDYDEALALAGEANFAVTAGIVRVDRQLDVPGQDPVRPGVYWVRLWFDRQQTFLGAALFGVTTDDVLVPGQTIPATPAYFLDADDERKIVSWISGWRLCKWCKWQSNCP